MSTAPGTIGIIGAGKSGVAIARLALAAGYTVNIASSGLAAQNKLMVDIVAPGATAADIDNVAEDADLVVIAVPLRRFRELPLSVFADQTVVDVMNYWPPIDGVLPEFENDTRPSSAVIQDALPRTARLVKSFNHLGYHQMEDLADPADSSERAAVAIAGDDPAANDTVAQFVQQIGFTPVLAGPLSTSQSMQPDADIFGKHLTATELRQRLTDTARQLA